MISCSERREIAAIVGGLSGSDIALLDKARRALAEGKDLSWKSEPRPYFFAPKREGEE